MNRSFFASEVPPEAAAQAGSAVGAELLTAAEWHYRFIQSLANDVPLVAGKPTAERICPRFGTFAP